MQRTTMPFTYFHGEIIPSEKAQVNIASFSLQYGSTCFGGIRGYLREGEIRLFRLKDHHERLMNAAKILNYPFYLSFEEFKRILGDLIAKNNPTTDFYIRPFIFTNETHLIDSTEKITFELAIYLLPLAHYIDPTKGLRLTLSSWEKFSDAALPTKAKAGGCYVNSILAMTDAKRHGYDDALMMDHQGCVVEGSVANLLIVWHGRIIMPETGSAALEGITSRTVVELLKEAGNPVHFERIDRSMIYSCQELILMGTAFQVSYGSSVDGRNIGSLDNSKKDQAGPICQLLREKFTAIIDKKHPKAQEWITTF